ncbi:TPA: hypothetical protein DIC39_01650 [Patescibacteria group bacterium]|nr:hypothetical protein [Patescibacteria group bacterium]
MHDHTSATRTLQRSHWIVICILAIAVILLIASYWINIFGILPYLFILACPLVHLFMHKGHGQASHDQRDEK